MVDLECRGRDQLEAAAQRINAGIQLGEVARKRLGAWLECIAEGDPTLTGLPHSPGQAREWGAAIAVASAVNQAEPVWRVYDRKLKLATAPIGEELVWIYERYYHGVTLGYFDGFTFRVWTGSDDCSVTHWAPMARPAAPEGADGDD